jgi:DNA segregation ATPase FtsK/SpoIIIE, S-DNA-T family
MKRHHTIRGLFFILLGLLLLVSLRTFRPEDWPGWSWDSSLLQAGNAFGFIGALLAKPLIFLLGNLAIVILPPLLIILAVTDLFNLERGRLVRYWGAGSLLLLLWSGTDLGGGPVTATQGWLGVLLIGGLRSLTGATGSLITLIFLTLIAVVAILPGSWLKQIGTGVRSGLTRLLTLPGKALMIIVAGVKRGGLAVAGSSQWIRKMTGAGFVRMSDLTRGLFASTRGVMESAQPEPPVSMEAAVFADEVEEQEPESMAVSGQDPLAMAAAAGGETVRSRAPKPRAKTKPVKTVKAGKPHSRGEFPLPDLELLAPAEMGDLKGTRERLEERAQVMVDKLASFNIGGKISAMSMGPVVTTYEFEPDTGVKVVQITGRKEDLALAMRSKELRMIAPIPGKAAVGVEVPNPDPRLIRLREVLEAEDFRGEKGELSLALGVDVDGNPYWADLASMPHLLVAGATGTGKSVCINTILISLLLQHGPDTLKLFLIDPKMLELSIYNDVPHLLHPVITDNRQALQALNWLVGEMERRYQLLKPASVRSITEYNLKVRAGKITDEMDNKITETLPCLVGVVEEFADLMMTMGKDIQTPIIRLAQMARAVGIHLILATQRPSVDIIDGVIKANFPSRIAFKVFSRVDSKTILDGNGAETLIGRGDMLFKHGRQPFPIRIHGGFVETEEVEAVVDHWRKFKSELPHLELDHPAGSDADFSLQDELFNDCKRIVIEAEFASTTMLQRRLRIGYTRASRIMDMLEEAGVVGPHTGSKAREVLVGPEALLEDKH